MNFDRINLAGCIIAQAAPPTPGDDGGGLPDGRCADAAFAAANPLICGAAAYLIIKPGVALLCKLGSINFSVFLYQNGIEILVTDGLTFSSSDPDILAIGVHTGSATGLADGEVDVTVSRNGLTAKAAITVLALECGDRCGCDLIHVKTSILIDDSKSVGLAFGGGYSSRLAFAKAAALDYAGKILRTCGETECVNLIPDGATYGEFDTEHYIVAGLIEGESYQIIFGANEISFKPGSGATILNPGNATPITFIAGSEEDGNNFLGTMNGIPVTATICKPVDGVGSVPKDAVKIWSFTDIVSQLSSDFLQDVDVLAAEINGIVQTQQKTDIGAILTAAVNDMLAATADEKIIVIVSDGEHTSNSNTQAILDTATLFKAAGGIIICIGLRASGAGYDLLSRIATGGFFLNAIPNNAADVLDEINYLKFILCAGDCITDGESVNTPALDYSSFINWEVIDGQVNLIGNGFLDLQPGNGLYVDMMGGSAGTIRTIDSFSLTSGQSYRISFKAAGNNRLNSLAGQKLKVSVMNADDSVPLPLALIFDHVVAPNWDDPFSTYSFSFTAPFDVDVKILFQQLFDVSFVGEWHGNLLDNLKFEEVSTLTTLFSDNFDGENPVARPGNDYGGYCSTGVATTQNPDPNPLPDVENGLPATITYTSTKTACASCPVGSINFPTQSIVPVMTSNTLPGGVVSDNAGSADAWQAFDDDADTNWTASILASWLRYQLVNTKKVTAYSLTATSDATTAPSSWILQGSNNGTTWVDLDTQAGIVWFTGETKRFAFTNVTGYLYYRFSISATQSGDPAQISEVQLFESAPTQVCKSATATSFVSQADADSKATLAAQADAQSNLNCVQRFSSTQQYTASCPAGAISASSTPSPVTRSATVTSLNSQNEADASALALAIAATVGLLDCVFSSTKSFTASCQYGTYPVTRSATRTSVISQADADAVALAAATSAANAALDCTQFNNNSQTVFTLSAGIFPYPSNSIISGRTGLITKVVVNINGMDDNEEAGLHLMLVSPAGTKVELLRRAGSTGVIVPIGQKSFTVDDAGSVAPTGSHLVNGANYKPTQYGGFAAYPSPCPAGSPNLTLAALIGQSANGGWYLFGFLENVNGQQSTRIASWSLTITTA